MLIFLYITTIITTALIFFRMLWDLKLIYNKVKELILKLKMFLYILNFDFNRVFGYENNFETLIRNTIDFSSPKNLYGYNF